MPLQYNLYIILYNNASYNDNHLDPTHVYRLKQIYPNQMVTVILNCTMLNNTKLLL